MELEEVKVYEAPEAAKKLGAKIKSLPISGRKTKSFKSQPIDSERANLESLPTKTSLKSERDEVKTVKESDDEAANASPLAAKSIGCVDWQVKTDDETKQQVKTILASCYALRIIYNSLVFSSLLFISEYVNAGI